MVLNSRLGIWDFNDKHPNIPKPSNMESEVNKTNNVTSSGGKLNGINAQITVNNTTVHRVFFPRNTWKAMENISSTNPLPIYFPHLFWVIRLYTPRHYILQSMVGWTPCFHHCPRNLAINLVVNAFKIIYLHLTHRPRAIHPSRFAHVSCLTSHIVHHIIIKQTHFNLFHPMIRHGSILLHDVPSFSLVYPLVISHNNGKWPTYRWSTWWFNIWFTY
jgi:hypothetical protein